MQAIRPIFPSLFANIDALTAAQSTREGGFSKGSYQGLNLGSHTDDEPALLIKNKTAFCDALGFSLSQVAKSKQIHGDKILTVTEAGNYEGYDALITDQKSILLAVSTADCVPVLMCDPIKQIIAAVHAGWKGTVLGLAAKTVTEMARKFGTQPNDVMVYIGACIDNCHFEVGQDVLDQFDRKYKLPGNLTDKGYVDLKQANFDQIISAGILPMNIEVSAYCTYDRSDLFYSHRRDKGITGRMWSVIGFTNN